MNCEKIFFSGHALRRMFERGISVEDVVELAKSGEIIASYPDDTPLPSYLKLGFARGKPLHVVVALNVSTRECHIITAYPPDPAIWQDDFKTRR